MAQSAIIFTKYRTLLTEVDEVFTRMRDLFPEEVQCNSGCHDCCAAVFYLQLVEAVSIGIAFRELPEKVKERAVARAHEAQTQNEELRDKVLKLQEQGQTEALAEISVHRIMCPLHEDGRCLLYKQRPITCRIYGIPTFIEDAVYSCPLSRFQPDRNYPVIDMDEINEKLRGLSRDLYKHLTNQPMPPEDILLPISAVILEEGIQTDIVDPENAS